jgi:hypothetical protein
MKETGAFHAPGWVIRDHVVSPMREGSFSVPQTHPTRVQAARIRRTIMKAIFSLLFGLSVLLAAAGPAAAADCKVTGWTSGYGSHPIFVCPGEPQ